MRQSIKVVFVPAMVAFALSTGIVVSSKSRAATPQSSADVLKSVPPRIGNATALRGSARAVDGDTLDIAIDGDATRMRRVRLEGIDAAEGGQRCKLKWIGTWDCGRAATIALDELIAQREVSCDDRGPDKYGRTLGICYVDGRDINGALVKAGLAWAFVQYSALYVADEAEARAQKLGIWQGQTMPAWQWRAQQRAGAQPVTQPPPKAISPPTDRDTRAAQPAAPRALAQTDCLIKGNVTKFGRIYHTPTSPWYDRIRMDDAQGERRWFCSEAEARDAGWRPVGSVWQ